MEANSMGTPMPFTFNGKTYMVAPRTIDQELAFQRHLEAEELRAIRGKAEILTEAEYASVLGQWAKTCALKKYRHGEQLWAEAMRTGEGVKYAYALAIAEGSGILLDAALTLMDEVEKSETDFRALHQMIQVLNNPNRNRPTEKEQPSAST